MPFGDIQVFGGFINIQHIFQVIELILHAFKTLYQGFKRPETINEGFNGGESTLLPERYAEY